MVQIIQEQRRPSFSDQLLSGLQEAAAQGAVQVPALMAHRAEQQQNIEAVKRLLGEDISGLSPENQKMYVEGLIRSRNQQKESKKDIAGTFDQILDEMEDLTSSVGPLNLKALSPWSETSGKRSQINTLRLSLEGLFRDLTLKGQFPKAIYERILKELPSASDTETQYRNKIKAIRKMLQSHYGEKEEVSGSSSREEGAGERELTPESMQEIYRLSKGDKNKAKKIAKKMGYKL